MASSLRLRQIATMFLFCFLGVCARGRTCDVQPDVSGHCADDQHGGEVLP